MKHKQVDDVGVTNNPQHKRWAGDASTSRVGKETKQAVGAILRSSGLLLLTGEEGRSWYAAPLGDNLVLWARGWRWGGATILIAVQRDQTDDVGIAAGSSFLFCPVRELRVSG